MKRARAGGMNVVTKQVDASMPWTRKMIIMTINKYGQFAQSMRVCIWTVERVRSGVLES